MTHHSVAPNRRAVLLAAAWSAPAITIAAAAPAFAASGRPPQGTVVSQAIRKYSVREIKHVEWQFTFTNTGDALANPVFDFSLADNAGVAANSITISGGTASWTVTPGPELLATYNGTIPAGGSISVTVDFTGESNNAAGTVDVKVYAGQTILASGSADF